MKEEMKHTSSRTQNIVSGSISFIGTMSIYIGGITLHRENPKFLILATTTVISLASPKFFYEVIAYGQKKWKQKKKEKRREV